MLPLKRRKLHLHLKHDQRLAAADESESLRLKQAAMLKAKKDQRRGGDGCTTARDNEEEHRLQSKRIPTDVISGRWAGGGGGQRETHKEHQGRRRPFVFPRQRVFVSRDHVGGRPDKAAVSPLRHFSIPSLIVAQDRRSHAADATLGN